jgi:hypothetical protein
MTATNIPDQVRWFEALGRCCGCKKPATGKLRGPLNESYGAYCRPCAERRLKKAEKERAAALKQKEAALAAE